MTEACCADSATVDHTAEPSPAHTGGGHSSGPDPSPGCTGGPPGCVYLLPDERDDHAGRHVDIGDVDGDGALELLVSESAPWAEPGLNTRAVHVLRAPIVSGGLWDRPGAHLQQELGDPPGWGYPAVLLPEAGQVFLAAQTDNARAMDSAVFAGDLRGVIAWDAHAGRVSSAGLPRAFPIDATPCALPGMPVAVCGISATRADGEVWTLSGAVYVVAAPIAGDVLLVDSFARYDGDVADCIESVHGGSDLTGDGRADLAVGANQCSNGPGRVAVVHDGPPGEHRLWDVTDTTFQGDVVGAQFGLGLSAGDLDGDGSADLLVGAPLGTEGAAYVFRGPLQPGAHSTETAAWTFRSEDGQFFGYDLSVGDFDGDGRQDLAVGHPGSQSSEDPGEVLVYLAPPPGIHAEGAAAGVLHSGVGVRDGFGTAMDAGDLDGDGRDDLAVGAPQDPQLGYNTGSVTIFPGAGLR